MESSKCASYALVALSVITATLPPVEAAPRDRRNDPTRLSEAQVKERCSSSNETLAFHFLRSRNNERYYTELRVYKDGSANTKASDYVCPFEELRLSIKMEIGFLRHLQTTCIKDHRRRLDLDYVKTCKGQPKNNNTYSCTDYKKQVEPLNDVMICGSMGCLCVGCKI